MIHVRTRRSLTDYLPLNQTTATKASLRPGAIVRHDGSSLPMSLGQYPSEQIFRIRVATLLDEEGRDVGFVKILSDLGRPTVLVYY